MKKLFLLAWPIALAAVSCSNEEVVSVNNDANEITFTAVANNATRAFTDSVYCNNWKPGSFHVWALAKTKDAATVAGKSYFQEVLYSTNFDESKNPLKTLYSADQANIRFWPNQSGDALDFYVMHNYGGTVKWTPDATGETAARLAVEGYTLTTTVADQQDFIYAVKQNQVKNGNVGTIGINFRHALSQVVFRARNTNKTLHVEIANVTVKNFYSKGNFALPLKNTENNKEDHTAYPSLVPEAGTTGTWSSQDVLASTTVSVYPTTTPAPVEANYAIVNYTSDSDAATNLTMGKDNVGDRDFSKAMLFIPQQRNAVAVTPGAVDSDKLKNDDTNPYFVVDCKIWNVEGGADGNTGFNNGTDVLLYNGLAYIPVTVNWEPGKKYIYTFVFGKTNGGYDEDGNDILVPISFEVKVDDFTPVVKEDIEMKK